MNKKLLVLPLAMLMLVACGKGETSQNSTTVPDVTVPPTVSTTVPPTVPPTATVPPTVSTTVPPSVSTVESVKATVQQAQEVALALANNAVSDQIYEVEGTITGVVGRSYHIQDGDFGIFVYHGTSSEALPTGFAVGKKIRVTAYITNYNGLPQLAYKNKVQIVEEVLGEGDNITPYTLDTLDLSQQLLTSRLVSIEGLTYVSGRHTVNASSRSNIVFKKGEVNIYCYVDKTMDDLLELAIQTMLSGFTANETVVNYTGNLAFNSTTGGLNLMPTSADNFTVV